MTIQDFLENLIHYNITLCSEPIPQDNWDEETPQENKECFRDYMQMTQQLGS